MVWLAGHSVKSRKVGPKKGMWEEISCRNVIYTSSAFSPQKRCPRSPNNFLKAMTLKMLEAGNHFRITKPLETCNTRVRWRIFLLPLFSRLSLEDLEHLNEDGELWFAYEGLKKATQWEIPPEFFLIFRDNEYWKVRSLSSTDLTQREFLIVGWSNNCWKYFKN